MRNKVLLAVLVGLFCGIGTVLAASEGILSDAGFTVSGDMSVYNQYVWRGFVLDRDAVLQPSFYVSTPQSKFGVLKTGVWSSQDLENTDNLKSQENDFIVDYTYAWDAVSVSLGHTYYDFVDTDTFSREAYVGVTFPKLLFSPSVFYYRDYGNPEDGGGEGSYTLISGAYSIPIANSGFKIDLGANVGLNHELFLNGDGGNVGLKAGIFVPLTKQLSVSPNVNYSIPFGDLANENDANQKSRFFGGATFVYSF